MELLKDKSFRSYDYISRYTAFPYFYHTIDNKYIYGTTAQLRDSNAYTLYVAKKGDSYDSIALRFYNNPTLFWVICDFNRIQDPFSEIEPGTKIKVPQVSAIVFDI